MPSIWRGLEAHKYILNGHLLPSVYVFFAVCSSHFIKMSPFPFLFACGISPGLQVHPVPPAGEMNVL